MTTTASSKAFAAWGEIADCYDAIDIDRAAMIAFYRSLVTPAIRSLIELACGTGTITIPLADRLFQEAAEVRVVGVDIDERMLSVARGRDPRIEWARGDLRSPMVTGQFDLAICCFNSLQAMLTEEDLSRALRAIGRLVKPSGMFALDLYQPNFASLKRRRTDHLARSTADRRGSHLEVREDYRYDAESRVLTIDWRVLKDGRESKRFRYYYRQYTAAEIERQVTANGFVTRERYGDFDRSPLTPSSKKQILLCARS